MPAFLRESPCEMVVVEERCGRLPFLSVAACQAEAGLVEVEDLFKISFAVYGSQPAVHTALLHILKHVDEARKSSKMRVK